MAVLDTEEGAARADQYDSFADRYHTANTSSLDNEYYERPAMIRLAGDVEGRQILDAGCGSGPLSAALRAKGAVMTGFDGSLAMVKLARQSLGPDVPLCVADLAAPLPYPNAVFDDAIASLVLHYLGDWSGPLAELRRVLRRGGRLILSVPHPLVRAHFYPEEDYFATRQYTEDYQFGDHEVTLTHWHRPLHAMTDAFTSEELDIIVLSEPGPSPSTPAELLPSRIRSGERTAFLEFIFFVLRAH